MKKQIFVRREDHTRKTINVPSLYFNNRYNIGNNYREIRQHPLNEEANVSYKLDESRKIEKR